MSSELIFLSVMFADLFFVLVCFVLGREYLYAAVIANIIFANLVAGKLITVFGFTQTASNAFYASIFLATDLLSEHHGRKDASRAIWLGLVGMVPIIFFGPMVASFISADTTGTLFSDSLGVVLEFAPRIAVASLITYVISQNVDIWLYGALKSRLPGTRFLWLRNNGSTLTSQFIDQVLFITLAFAGTLPWEVMLQIFLAGYMVKVIVAFCDTPFVYAAHMIEGWRAERRARAFR